jgi:serine/threonine protein kinase
MLQDRKELFKQIREMPINVPRHASKETADFIHGLLQRNPSKRLGSHGDATQLKVVVLSFFIDIHHTIILESAYLEFSFQFFFCVSQATPFFTSWIDWDKMHNRLYEPPFKPCTAGI